MIKRYTYSDYRNDVYKVMGITPVKEITDDVNKDAEIKRLQQQLKKEKNNNANLRDRLHHKDK